MKFRFTQNIYNEIRDKDLLRQIISLNFDVNKVKSGKYSIEIQGKTYIVSKKSIRPFITKKEFNNFAANFSETLKEKSLFFSNQISPKMDQILLWYGLVEEDSENRIISKRFKKIGLKGLRELLISVVKKPSNREQNQKIKKTEISLMYQIAEKYGYEIKEKYNYDECV